MYPVGDHIHLEGSCSVAKLYSTFYDPMDCSMPGLPVPHYLLEGPAPGLILFRHYLDFLIVERVDLHFHFAVELANYVAVSG